MNCAIDSDADPAFRNMVLQPCFRPYLRKALPEEPSWRLALTYLNTVQSLKQNEGTFVSERSFD